MGLFDKKGKKEETVTPSVEPVSTTEPVVASPQVAVEQTEAPTVQNEVSMDNNPFVEAPAPVEEVVEPTTPEVSFDEVFNATPNDLVPSPTEAPADAAEVAVPVMEETAATVETPQPLPEASLNVNPEEIVGEVTKEDEITQIVSDSVAAQDDIQVAQETAPVPAPSEESTPEPAPVIPTPEQLPADAAPTPTEPVEVIEPSEVEVTPTEPVEAPVEQPVETVPTDTIEEFNDISSTEIILPAEVQESQAETEQLLMEEQVNPPEETIELSSEPLTTPTVEPSFVVPQNSIMASNPEEESIISVPPLKTAESTTETEEITLPEPAIVSEVALEETPAPVETTAEVIETSQNTIEENVVTEEVTSEIPQEVTPEIPQEAITEAVEEVTPEVTEVVTSELEPENQVSAEEQEAQPAEQIIEEAPIIELASEPTIESVPDQAPTEEPTQPATETEVPDIEVPSTEEPNIETVQVPEASVESPLEQAPTQEELPQETTPVEASQEETPIEAQVNTEPSEVVDQVSPEEMPAIAENKVEEESTEQASNSTPTETPTIIEEGAEEVIPVPSNEPLITEESEDISTIAVEPTTEETQSTDESESTPIIEEDETVILPIVSEDMEIPTPKEESVATEAPIISEEPVITEKIEEPVITEEPAEPIISEEPAIIAEPIISEPSKEEIIVEEKEEIPLMSDKPKDEIVSPYSEMDSTLKGSAPIIKPQPDQTTKKLEKPQLTEREGIVTYISDPTPTRFCNNCGIMLTDDSSICPSCGEPID